MTRVERAVAGAFVAVALLVAGCAPTNPDAPPQQAQDPPARSDDPRNPKPPEAWCLERPTAWYLLVVHDYAVYKGLREKISDDAEWMVLGVFGTNDECSDSYMNRVLRTADDYDRFWSCLPNTDPVLTRWRVKWQQFPRPEAPQPATTSK
jgi:hypothetical protein